MVGNAEAAAASSGRVRGFQPQGQAQPSAGRGDRPGDIAAELRVHGRQMPAADFADRVVHLMDQIIEHFKRNKLQLYLIRRNFSWPMVEHELSQPSDPVWQDLASALEHSPLMERYTPEELFRLIFVLVEMCGSICYASIIEGRPAGIEQMKPILYDIVRKSLEG